MPFPRAGFGLVSLKTGFASDVTNILAIGGIQLNRETVNRIFYILRIHFILFKCFPLVQKIIFISLSSGTI